MFSYHRIRRTNFASDRSKPCQSGVRFAHLAAYVDDVAGFRAGPQQRMAAPKLAHDGHVNEDAILPGRVATGDRAMQLARGATQTAQEISQPTTSKFVGN